MKIKEECIRNVKLEYPLYLPDATRAVVKGLDSKDIQNAGIEGVVINTYHLMETPGTQVLENFGGVKNFMKFEGLAVSDSGGWQVFSLIHRNGNKGLITDEGVVFMNGVKKKQLFSPERSIQVQFSINSDIIICLDDFTPPNAPKEKIKESVDRTILWAKKSRTEYLKQVEQRNLDGNTRPLLLAVIQGGLDKELRKYCAQKLIEIGFDAYGFGGYVIDVKTKKLDLDMSQFVANLIPDDKIKFALGVGNPYDITMCTQMGWQIFDCTLPTRDARHKRLYNFSYEPKSLQDLLNPKTYEFLYVGKEKHKTIDSAVSPFCDCFTCKNYSLGYLSHLFTIGDNLALRLATIHNIRHYTKLTEYLRFFN